jgi:hypothetical protein
MVRRLFSALGLALVAGAAAAQPMTTNCHPTYAGAPQLGMTCDSNGPQSASPGRPPQPVVYSWKDVKPEPCSKFESLSRDGNYCEARLAASNRKAVGNMIAAGRCDDALKAALGTGDLAFAREVRDFCGK